MDPEIIRLLNTKKIETERESEKPSPSPTLSLPSTIIVKDKSSINFIEDETITEFRF